MASSLLLPEDYLDGLDATATAAALEDAVTVRRAAEVNDLLLVARWADLFATDPRHDPRPDPDLPRPPGSDRLVRVGGEGTSPVRELALCEAAIARSVHPHAMRSITADVLDLRHRLPRTWARLTDLECEPWLARKIAAMTRHLPHARVHVVDTAVAAALPGQAPGRVLTLCEAKIIEADPALHDERLARARHRKHVTLTRIDEAGLRGIIAKVTAGDALWLDAAVTRLAEILATHPEQADRPRDELRAVALGILARPAEALALLLEGTHVPATEGPDEPADAEPGSDGPSPDAPAVPAPSRAVALPADLLPALRGKHVTAALRPRAVVYVHLHAAALTGRHGVARVEDLGPHTLTQLRDLLGHAHVTLKPVIDLNEKVAVNAYEHPEHLKERIHLTKTGCAFPHATSLARRTDHDHPVPYDPLGPPGQTNSHDSQPLSRTPHRAKTHLGYTATPHGPDATVWRTPHGRHRWVDVTGTHRLTPDEVRGLDTDDPVTLVLTRLQIRRRTGSV